MGIKENVRRIRTERGLTQEQLAVMVGVNRSTITQWETGWSQPRMAAAQRLADALGVKVSEIIEDAPPAYAYVHIPELTADERDLLDLYRNMDNRARRDLLAIARSLSPARASVSDIGEGVA